MSEDKNVTLRLKLTAKSLVLGVICGLFTVAASAQEIGLHCQGPSEENSVPAGKDNLTVFIDVQRKHLKVNWDQVLVIDNPMEIDANEYSYFSLNADASKADRMFSINRTNLRYSFGIYLSGLSVFRTSEGQCRKIEQQI